MPIHKNIQKINRFTNNTRKNKNNMTYGTKHHTSKNHTNYNIPKNTQHKLATTTINPNGPRPTGLGQKIHMGTPPHTKNKDIHAKTRHKKFQKINNLSNKTQKKIKNTPHEPLYNTSKRHTQNNAHIEYQHQTLTATTKIKWPHK